MVEVDRSGSPNRPVAHPGVLGLSWLSHSELAWLIARLPDRGLFVEIGTASGATAAVVADAKPGLSILCLDPFVDHDAPHVTSGDRCRIDTWRRNRRPNMNLWVGTAQELIAVAMMEADAILVDGDHEEAGVARDLESCSGLIAPGGPVFCHDYDEPGHPGVTVAVDAFCGRSGFSRVGQHWTLCELRRP